MKSRRLFLGLVFALALAGCSDKGSILGTWTASMTFTAAGKPQTNVLTLVIEQTRATFRNDCTRDGAAKSVQVASDIVVKDASIEVKTADSKSETFVAGATCNIELERGEISYTLDGNKAIFSDGRDSLEMQRAN